MQGYSLMPALTGVGTLTRPAVMSGMNYWQDVIPDVNYSHGRVQSDHFVLLAELLSSSDLREALRAEHLDGTVTEPRSKELPLSVKLTSEVEKFMAEVASAKTLENEPIFEYWPDTGSGSWIRLSQKKGLARNGQNGSYSRYGSYIRKEQGQVSDAAKAPTQPSGRGALPGWISRERGDERDPKWPPAKSHASVAPVAGGTVQEAAKNAGTPDPPDPGTGVACKGPVEPVPPTPTPLAPVVPRAPVAPAVFEASELGDPMLKRNKASNKMRLDVDEKLCSAPSTQSEVSPKAPDPPPVSLLQATVLHSFALCSTSPRPRPPPEVPSTPVAVPPPPPLSPKEAPPPPPEPAKDWPGSVKRGRFKSFSIEKGFGFIYLEENVDVFAHISVFQGPKPEDFSGLPGMPPVGQEVEFTMTEGWRHNLGTMVLEALAKQLDLEWSWWWSCWGWIAEEEELGFGFFLPRSFYNTSGWAVQRVMELHGLEAHQAGPGGADGWMDRLYL
eukprot:g28291.t1